MLIESKPLVILAAALFFFHLGNAAMLPLYGLAVVASKQADPAAISVGLWLGFASVLKPACARKFDQAIPKPGGFGVA